MCSCRLVLGKRKAIAEKKLKEAQQAVRAQQDAQQAEGKPDKHMIMDIISVSNTHNTVVPTFALLLHIRFLLHAAVIC